MNKIVRRLVLNALKLRVSQSPSASQFYLLFIDLSKNILLFLLLWLLFFLYSLNEPRGYMNKDGNKKIMSKSEPPYFFYSTTYLVNA